MLDHPILSKYSNTLIAFFSSAERPKSKSQYILSVLIICFVSALCFLFSSFIGAEVVAFILLLALSVIAMLFDIFPVLLSAFLSALIWDYFFLQPRFNLRVGDTEDKIMLSMYFVIASVSAVLTFKLRKMEKLASIKNEKEKALKLYNTLFNSLSHEFRTPISTIMGATDNLLEEPSKLSDPEQKTLLFEISSASLRLNQQVENLLNMSRLESGFLQPKKEWCDINEIINSVLQRLDGLLGSFTLEVTIKENLPFFKLDYRLIEQVLYNLIYNATQYIPENSLIAVRADCSEGRLVLVVEDNGQGFPEDEIENVFEKFYRLKNVRGKGTGLGLSIAKGFIEAHNGTIELENKAGGGARFIITMPAERYHFELTAL